MRNLHKVTLCVSVFALQVFLVLVLLDHFKKVTESENDLYFHLAIAKESAHKGILHTLPQVEHLGWGEFYPEKNFLFTQLLRVAYLIGGEAGVRLLIPILASTFFWLLFWILYRSTNYQDCINPLLGFFLVLVTPYFIIKLVILRPHLLAMIVFLLYFYGILKKSPLLLLITGTFFSLSYHALYIPLALIAVATLTWWRLGELNLKVTGFAILGLSLGMVFHPYFPANLEWMAVNIRIALEPGFLGGTADLPGELRLMNSKQFVENFGAYLIILLASLYGFTYISTRFFQSSDQANYVILCVSAFLFWILALRSLRAIEYAIPTTCILMVYVGRLYARRAVVSAAFVLVLLIQTPVAAKRYLKEQNYNGFPMALLTALDEIPNPSTGKKIFNCEWSFGPYIFYKRPEMRFVDVWGPYLLAFAEPRIHYLRDSLRFGKVPHPYEALKEETGAHYVLCESPAFVQQMELDPHFTRVYPKGPSIEPYLVPGHPFLYQLAEKPIRNFISNYEVLWEKQWESVRFTKKLDSKAPAYLNINRWMEYRKLTMPSERSWFCLAIRPHQSELAAHEGATHIGVGGGSQIRLRWNGKPLYFSNIGYQSPTLIRRLVKLPRPLSRKDSFFASVCTFRSQPVFGFSLSFWNEEQIDSICRKKMGTESVDSTETHWAYSDHESKTCLGEVAMRSAGVQGE